MTETRETICMSGVEGRQKERGKERGVEERQGNNIGSEWGTVTAEHVGRRRGRAGSIEGCEVIT